MEEAPQSPSPYVKPTPVPLADAKKGDYVIVEDRNGIGDSTFRIAVVGQALAARLRVEGLTFNKSTGKRTGYIAYKLKRYLVNPDPDVLEALVLQDAERIKYERIEKLPVTVYVLIHNGLPVETRSSDPHVQIEIVQTDDSPISQRCADSRLLRLRDKCRHYTANHNTVDVP